MSKLIDLLGLNEFGKNVRDWVNTHFQRKVDGKGLSTYDYDKTAKDKVDAIPANPQYTDTTYEAGEGISIEDNVISATGGGGEENAIEAITMNGASVPVTNKTAEINETDPTVPSWAKQQNKPSYQYSEIGNTPDLSGFITKSVNDLTNYYLKSETYTKAEVAALIGAIQQFHYEIYSSLPTSGESNVLYLIGPIGSGSDKYEEYVYSNNDWHKIGDTSIDLSGYVTTSALNTALADYTTTANLTTLLDGKQDTISDLATIRSGASLGATAYQKPNAGIPASDLESGVIPNVPVQDVTVGGTSVVNNGTAEIPDTNSFEASANKVSSISGNETDTSKYPNTKAVADALGKCGVISQTQTWSGTGSQSKTYVMSDLVRGLIPKANIDLFESAGATFNATTGYFELNGLTDISYEEMQKIYNKSIDNLSIRSDRQFQYYGDKNLRTLLPFYSNTYTGIQANWNSILGGVTKIETISSTDVVKFVNSSSTMFRDCGYLKNIAFVLNFVNKTSADLLLFRNCYSLENVLIKYLKISINLKESSSLQKESILYMINNVDTSATGIVVTLHSTVYSKCTTGGDWYNDVNSALSNHTNITLASG